VARQKLGQHFLTSGSILQRIAAAACPERVPLVIEIGPGRGALTEKLLKRADKVLAVEFDRDLAEYLRSRFPHDGRLEVVAADVLRTDLAAFGRAPVAGNLPYYITSPIIEQALRLSPPRAVFLVQKEVADRITATPGRRDYGYLSVQVAAFAKPRTLFGVPPGAFQPPPKVDSAVVLLEPLPSPVVEDMDGFLRFVGLCFQHKRKTLRNNLAENLGRDVVDSWPEAGMRAEQISLEGFIRMYGRIKPVPEPAV
jgi:16S rRNA (adenine1518-N6/adenine1519-N6)-dimethyltransferase